MRSTMMPIENRWLASAMRSEMTSFRVALTLLALMCTASVIPARGLSQSAGLLTWDFTFDNAPISLGDRLFRVFDEPARYGLFLRIVNGTSSAIAIDQAKLREAAQLKVVSDEPVVVSASWLPDIAILEGSEVIERVDLHSAITISPEAQARWRLSVQRRDGRPFARGEYQVELSVTDLAFATQALTGEPWRNRSAIADRGAVTVRVEPPSSPKERLTMHIHHARAAALGGDNEGALSEFRKAVSLDPTSTEARAGLGGTLLSVGRYREAAAVYEVVLAREKSEGRTFVVDSLALAYVGTGNEEEAARLLRTLGRREETVIPALNEMKMVVERRQSR